MGVYLVFMGSYFTSHFYSCDVVIIIILVVFISFVSFQLFILYYFVVLPHAIKSSLRSCFFFPFIRRVFFVACNFVLMSHCHLLRCFRASFFVYLFVDFPVRPFHPFTFFCFDIVLRVCIVW